MTKKLKSCPFCGGEAHFDSEYGYDVFISCSSCEARGKVFNLDNFSDCEDARMSDVRMFAVAAWNKRYEITEELKPCPFCGNESLVFRFWVGHGEAHEYAYGSIACGSCKAVTVWTFDRDDISRNDAQRFCSDAWNRRVQS